MKILKKILKITGIVFASIILFMVLLVVGAKIFESELASIAMTELESDIEAPMSIGKVSLIPLFSFPRISAEINNLWIGDPESKNNDTLFYINSLKVGLDSWDLFKGIYTIDKVEISGLDFDYIINKNGKSNIDFLIDAFVDTTAKLDSDLVNPNDTLITPLDLTAEKLKLENIRVHYYDSLTGTASQIFIPEITLKAKAKNDVYKVETEGNIVLSHLLLEGTKVDRMKSCSVDFDLEYEGNHATINKLNIKSEGIELGVEVSAKLGDTLVIDASLEAFTIDFDILKKYLPDEYISLLDGAKSDLSPFTVDVNMEYAGNDAIINKLLIKTDGIDLGLNGAIKLDDTITVDATFNANTLDIDVLKKFIPKQYLEEYGIVDMGGMANASARVKGKYADSTLLPLVNMDINFKNIRLQTKDYPEIKKLNLAANIVNGEKADFTKATINIKSLEINTLLSSVQLQGNVHGLTNPKYDISTQLELNLAEFKKYIPDSLAQNLKGNISATFKTNGTLPEKIPDDFVDYVLDRSTLSAYFKEISGLLLDSLQVNNFSSDITFSPQISGDKNIQIKNLDLKSETLNINLQNSSLTAILSGKVSKLSTMVAELQSFRIQNGSNLIVGSADIINFDEPEFYINTNIMLSLEELMPFAPDSLIKNMTGTVKASIQSKGKIHLDSLETQLYPILFENSSFDLTLGNISLEFPDPVMNVENISARLSMKNDVLKVDDFSATYNGLSLAMDSTIVQNIYKAVLLNQKEELYVKTHIKLGDIIYDEFKHLMAVGTTDTNTATGSSPESPPAEPQNWTFLIHGSAFVNSFIIDSTVIEGYTINRLHVNDISTLFKLTDSSYIADQFKFKAFEGEMNNSFHYKVREDGTQSVSSRNVIKNMNIRTLLRDMDNFGMDSLISHEHISGYLSMDLNTFVPVDDSVLIDKILVSGDVVLEKGGVYDYPPAQEISSLPGLKELDNLQFKTLRSNIFMFKSKMYVPRTNIVSNEIDIAAFGMQGMDYDCEYHLEVHLGSILFGKSKKRTKKQDESGDEIDVESLKKSSRKIRYSVEQGESKVKMDSKESREAMMNKIRTQEKMLNFIFFPKNIHYSTAVDKKN